MMNHPQRVFHGFMRVPPSLLLLLAAPVFAYAADAPGVQAEMLSPAWQTQKLQDALTRYQALEQQGGWPLWKKGAKPLKNKTDSRMVELREELQRQGDCPQPFDQAQNPLIYDDALATCAAHFQARHGLNPDGEIGQATQAALNVLVKGRIHAMEATLARLKDASEPAARSVTINLPAYTLYALSSGQPVLSMRVILGDVKHQTPLFTSAVTAVTFNPSWNVPVSIAKKELTAKLLDDPDYFAENDFVVRQNGQIVDPYDADASKGSFTFRQQAGDKNALGKIKFNLPDTDSIYLHSTSAPKFFAKDWRALSHGCIRLEKPRDMAYYVFAEMPKWDKARIDTTYDAPDRKTVSVKPTPVRVVYWTAFANEDGSVSFYSDVYKKDAQ
jgi:murein L,D-transpeptidase YcbB/YkuD